MKMNFIKTHDDNVAAQLRAAHFTYLDKDDSGMHVFINDGVYCFDESDKKKIAYTNVMSV